MIVAEDFDLKRDGIGLAANKTGDHRDGAAFSDDAGLPCPINPVA